MKTLFEKLSKENQEKVTIYFNNKKPSILNVLDEFQDYIYATKVDIYSAHQVFWAIYPDEPFDLIKYYKIFKIRNNDTR